MSEFGFISQRAIAPGLVYQGTWDALLNIPVLTSGVGAQGFYYIVSVAGNTNLDGITDWQIGDWAIFNGTVWQKIDNSDAITSVGLTMPSAFAVANSPLTSSGTIAVSGAGTAAQYVRGDGQLATFPNASSGGSSVNYYLNGSVAASVLGYQQMSNTAIIGAGTDFPLLGNGLIAEFLTDVANPNRLEIPVGAWNFEMYFSMSSSGGNTKFYVELLKYDGATFTSIASSSAIPEQITGGTAIDLYLTSLAVPQTVLLASDRLAVRVYIVDNSGGRTATLHTENSHLCEIITTFAGGVSALNGLTENTQYFATGSSGVDFNISSLVDTHTFNLPTASAINRGALSSADWSAFNGKVGGTGTTNYVAKFTGASAVGDSSIYDNGTNVGIGTTTPAAKLDVRTNVAYRGVIEATSLFAAGAFFNAFRAMPADGTVLDKAGLYMGSIAADNAVISSNTVFRSSGQWQSSSTTGSAIQLATGDMYFIANSGLTANTDYVPTTRLFIKSTGNVGIGTTAPLSQLGVLGNLSVGATYGAIAAPTSGAIIEGNVGIGISAPSGGHKVSILDIGTSNNGASLRITKTGAVVGTSYGIQSLLSGASTTNVGAYLLVAGATNNYALIVPSSGGRVGFGTSAPDTVLHVVGTSGTTIKIVDGNQAAGRVLTCDAAGVGSWAAVAGSGWSLTGNFATVDGTNFIGTNDNIPFNIRQNNLKAGRIGVVLEGSTFFGLQAGNANAANNFNTAIGLEALKNATNGALNVAVGAYAARVTTTGIHNTVVGVRALENNSVGDRNTAVGYEANRYQGGTDNAAFGYRAAGVGFSGTAIKNTSIGASALTNNEGTENTAVGFQAGSNVSTGINNTLIGSNTGLGITTGNRNTVIGATVTGLASGLSNNIILADGAGTIRLQFNNTGVLSLTGPTVTTVAATLPNRTIAITVGGTVYYVHAKTSND